MSEAEKNGAAQNPTDQVEADQISVDELDAVAGGVLALQEMQGGEQTEELSSLISNVCCLSQDAT